MRRALIARLLLIGALAPLGCPSSTPPPDGPGPDTVPPIDLGDQRLERRSDDHRTPDQRHDLQPCKDPGVTLAPGITVSPTILSPGATATVTYGAPAQLAASSNLSLHTAANFWGSTVVDLPMTKRSDGVFEVAVKLPADARLLDFVFFTTAAAGKQWDNNGGVDYHRSVGVFYQGPYLTLRDNLAGQTDRDPAQGLVVSFKTDHVCVGRVRYGLSPVALGSSVTGGAAKIHHLVLTGLAADTIHHYRVECQSAGSCASDISPTYAFRTAPQNATSLTFLHVSDTQFYRGAANHWGEAATTLSQAPHDDARLFVITGDSTSDDSPLGWWDFFDNGRPLLASKVIVAAVGNHDTPTFASSANTNSFSELYDPQSSSGVNTSTTVRYGPASFLILNSETSQSYVSTTDWRPGGAQYSWAKTVVGQLGGTWRFAAWHIPPYNVGVRHYDQRLDTRPMTGFFNDVIDWVLCGHEHLYQRSLPIRATSTATDGTVTSAVVTSYGPGGGVGYLTNTTLGPDPSGGLVDLAARYRLAYPPEKLIDSNNTVPPWQGFVKIKLQGKTIELQAFALGDPTPRDSLTYTKP
jgi:hypothetical protein